MGLINQECYCKGTIIDGGLGQSRGGLPQEEWYLKATEVWDEENGEYLPVDEDHDEITAYLILMSYKDKETKSAQQVKKVLGWNGANYPELTEIERADVPVSFRVKFGTGDYAENLQVSWVAEPDASPIRAVSKISKEDAAVLQARYAGALATTAAPVKAASAKTAKKTTKKTSKKPPAKPPKTDAVVGKCTDQEAYTECFALSGSEGGDEIEEKLNTVWEEEVTKVNVDEAKIKDEEWFEIKGRVAKRTSTVG